MSTSQEERHHQEQCLKLLGTHRNRVPPALGSAGCLLRFEESLDSQVGQPFSPMMFPLWGWLVSKSAPRGVSEASCLLSEGPALNEAVMIQPGTSSIRWEGGDEF